MISASTRIPDEIIHYILLYCCEDFLDLARYSHINQSWRRSVRTSFLWRSLPTTADTLKVPLQFYIAKHNITQSRIHEDHGLRQRMINHRTVCSFRPRLYDVIQHCTTISPEEAVVTPTIICDTYLAVKTRMNTYFQRLADIIPAWRRMNEVCENRVLGLGAFAFIFSFAGCIAIACCTHAAGPIQTLPYDPSYLYNWTVSFAVAYVILGLDLLVAVGAFFHLLSHRLVRECERFSLPWDTLSIVLLSLSLFLGLLSLLINAHIAFLYDDQSVPRGELLAGMLVPFGLCHTVAVLCILLPYSSFDRSSILYTYSRSNEANVLRERIRHIDIAVVYDFFFEAILDIDVLRDMTLHRLAITESAAAAPPPASATAPFIATAASPRRSSNRWRWWPWSSDVRGTARPPSDLVAQCMRSFGLYEQSERNIEERRHKHQMQCRYAVVYTEVMALVVLPVLVGVTSPAAASSSSTILFQMSLGLIMGALLLPLWLMIPTGMFICEMWNEDQENSRIPLSWAISYGVVIECGLCGWIFFVVWIPLRFAGVTTSIDISIPSVVAAALACAHVGVFGLHWHKEYFGRRIG